MRMSNIYNHALSASEMSVHAVDAAAVVRMHIDVRTRSRTAGAMDAAACMLTSALRPYKFIFASDSIFGLGERCLALYVNLTTEIICQ
jgi:hypothetical protein